MNKPVILAICGKSCTGKTALTKMLVKVLNQDGVEASQILSCTTRPMRPGEVDGVDYKFVDCEEFYELAANRKLLEHTEFRSWHYGSLKDYLSPGINVGIFNPQGLKNLSRHRNEYDIYVVLLSENLGTRLRRSREREGRWRLEFFRRAFVDWLDFRKIRFTLDKFCHIIYLKDVKTIDKKIMVIENRLGVNAK